MQNAPHILGYSLIAIAGIATIAVYGRGISGYGATFGNREFKYRFDKSRLPVSIFAVVVLAISSFVYSLLIARQVDVALLFTLVSTFVGGLGCIIVIAYVPRGKGD